MTTCWKDSNQHTDSMVTFDLFEKMSDDKSNRSLICKRNTWLLCKILLGIKIFRHENSSLPSQKRKLHHLLKHRCIRVPAAEPSSFSSPLSCGDAWILLEVHICVHVRRVFLVSWRCTHEPLVDLGCTLTYDCHLLWTCDFQLKHKISKLLHKINMMPMCTVEFTSRAVQDANVSNV